MFPFTHEKYPPLTHNFIWFLDVSLSIEHSSTRGFSNEQETAISFTLGDPDDGDEIVVDVYHDKTYSSFVFNTVAGRTRCHNEPGTIKGEGK